MPLPGRRIGLCWWVGDRRAEPVRPRGRAVEWDTRSERPLVMRAHDKTCAPGPQHPGGHADLPLRPPSLLRRHRRRPAIPTTLDGPRQSLNESSVREQAAKG